MTRVTYVCNQCRNDIPTSRGYQFSEISKAEDLVHFCSKQCLYAFFGDQAPSASDGVDRKTAQPITPQTAKTFALDVWADRLADLHIKPKDRGLVNVALMRVLDRCKKSGTDPEYAFGEIERALIAWNATPEWREKNGAYAPTLAAWIEDRGYKKWPQQTAQQPSSRDAAMDAARARMKAEMEGTK